MQRVQSDICYVFTLDVEVSLNLFSRRNGAFLVSETYSGYFTCHSTIYNLPLQLHSVLAIYMQNVLWIQIVIPRCFLSPILFFLRCERYLHVCDVLVSLNKCKPKKKNNQIFCLLTNQNVHLILPLILSIHCDFTRRQYFSLFIIWQTVTVCKNIKIIACQLIFDFNSPILEYTHSVIINKLLPELHYCLVYLLLAMHRQHWCTLVMFCTVSLQSSKFLKKKNSV